MIVNPAYAYMGKSAPANPVIFQRNEANYPYAGVNFEINKLGNFVLNGKSELVFSDLDLTNFTKLSVPGGHGHSTQLRMSAVFIDASGNTSPSVNKTYWDGSATTGVWDIPQQFRTKKCKVKFTTNNGDALTLYSATLS